MATRSNIRPPVSLLAAIMTAVVLIVAGCGEPPPDEEAISPDEKVLLALDCYNPLFKMDAAGQVTHLKLEGPHVRAEVLAEIGKLKGLRGLSLYAASITDESLAHLENLPDLHNLGLGATPITDQGIAHLEKLHGLRYTWLPRATVSQQAAEKLKAAVPGLTVYFQ